jgi:hypothetical protein
MGMEEFEGIGPAHAAKLETAGVTSAATLLAAGGTSAGRARLGDQTGIGAGGPPPGGAPGLSDRLEETDDAG